MNVQIEPTNDNTIHTDRNGHQYTVTHNHVLSGVVIGTTIKMVERTEEEKKAEYIQKMIKHGKVFECDRGVGIVAQGYLYLFTDGTVNVGCYCDKWMFESVEHAENFLADWVFEMDSRI
jgi:uncharacterized Ntn-hydrolase superfamily protein